MIVGRHYLKLFNKIFDGTLLIVGGLCGRRSVALSTAVLTEGVNTFLIDYASVRHVFSKIETDCDRLKDDVLALVAVPHRWFQDVGVELFLGAVAVVVIGTCFRHHEVLQVINIKGAAGVLSLGIACVPNNGLGITLEVPVDVRGKYVIRMAPEIKKNNGSDKPGRNLLKLPTPLPGDTLNGNHKQLRGGKGNVAHQETINFIHMITRTEIGFTDRPRVIQNFYNTILPIINYRILYFGLRTVLCSPRILGGGHKNVDSKHHVID